MKRVSFRETKRIERTIFRESEIERKIDYLLMIYLKHTVFASPTKTFLTSRKNRTNKLHKLILKGSYKI